MNFLCVLLKILWKMTVEVYTLYSTYIIRWSFKKYILFNELLKCAWQKYIFEKCVSMIRVFTNKVDSSSAISMSFNLSGQLAAAWIIHCSLIILKRCPIIFLFFWNVFGGIVHGLASLYMGFRIDISLYMRR